METTYKPVNMLIAYPDATGRYRLREEQRAHGWRLVLVWLAMFGCSASVIGGVVYGACRLVGAL